MYIESLNPIIPVGQRQRPLSAIYGKLMAASDDLYSLHVSHAQRPSLGYLDPSVSIPGRLRRPRQRQTEDEPNQYASRCYLLRVW